MSNEMLSTLATAVYNKVQNIRALKDECRNARGTVEAVRDLCADLEGEGMGNRPIGNAMGLLRSGLEDTDAVFEVCASQPLRAKVFSRTYISKLKVAVTRMRDGMNLLGGANVGLTRDLQKQVAEATGVAVDGMAAMQRKLDDLASGVNDAVGSELRTALLEHRGAEAVREELVRLRLATDVADAERQLRQLRLLHEEVDRVRQEKTFNREMDEEALLQAVCALSLAAEPPPVCFPDQFICPISLCMMEDPVIVVQSGISYERAQIEEALRVQPRRDPKTNQEWLAPLTLAPNVALRGMIREWHEGQGAGSAATTSRPPPPPPPPLQQAAVSEAMGMAADASIPSEVRKWVAQLRSGGDGQKKEGAAALARLARNADNQVAIAAAGGIAPLVALARGGTDGQKEHAAAALLILAVNDDNTVAIAKAGGIAPLVALARGGTDGQKERAAGALWNLAVNADNQVAIARAGGIAPLVALARGGTDGQKERAAGALAVLARNADNKVAIANAGWQ